MKTTEEIYKDWVAENPIDYMNTKFEAVVIAFAEYYAKLKVEQRVTEYINAGK